MVGVGLIGRALPAGFIPEEDQGLLGINVQLPPAASLERTSAVLRKVEEIVAKLEGIESYQTIGGYGVVTSTYQPNFGTVFARLKPWEERHGEALHVKGIMAPAAAGAREDPGSDRLSRSTFPTISGFGASAGFNFLLQDRSGTLSVDELGAQTRAFLAAARERPEFAALFTSFDPTYPQVKVELDREKARTLGVPVNDVFQAMSASMGGSYVNDFNRFGRLYRVYVQADADYRRKPTDIGDVYVRSKTTNTMIPLSTLVTITSVPGTEITTRFNLLRSVEINGYARARRTAPGRPWPRSRTSSRRRCPRRWASPTRRCPTRRRSAPPAAPTFILAIVFVFLLLAAMYESWRLPWAVLLGSPLVALGAFFGVWLAGLRQQRVRADRAHHARRPRRQERDPDRRVREGQARGRPVGRGRRARVRPAALPADLDDGLRLHPRRRAADAGERGGRRRPERHGHRRVLGDAGRHVPRGVPDPRELRLRRGAGPEAGAPAKQPAAQPGAPAHVPEEQHA